MRQKRAKAYRKLMSLYCLSFNFRQPYQVLIDSELCSAAISHKFELVKQLGVVLQGDVKPMITQCCITELYKQGRSQQAAVDLAKTFERRKCNHKEAISGDDCLKSVVGETNKHRYVIASQSAELRKTLREIPAVPLVHLNRSVLILEPPSDATITVKEKSEESARLPTDPERQQLAPAEEPPTKKWKGPKGPNPLSVKKKKTKLEDPLHRRRPPELGDRDPQRDVADADAEVGAKRARSEADEVDEETPAKKRRRRRKKLQESLANPTQSSTKDG